MYLKKLEGLLNVLLAIIGGALVGIGEAWILIPLKLTTGGFNGISMLVYYIFGIPVSVVSLALNIPLFIVSTKILGIKYSLKSLISMLSLSLMLSVATLWTPLTNDMILASIFGGTLVGLGLAITLKAESSTGGTDLLAKLIQTKFRHMNMGEIIFILDGLIIAFAAFTFDSIEIALYSGIAVFVMTKIMDLVLEGGKYAKAVYIISQKNDEIAEFIMNNVQRGVTFLKGTGGYTKIDENIILCLVNKREIPKVKDAVREIDDKAFMIVSTVSEAIGQGFQEKF